MDTSHERVKYYSAEDRSMGWYLPSVESKLTTFVIDQPIQDINDSLELYNITQIIQSGVRLTTWSEDYYKHLLSIVPSVFASIGRFFSKISNDNFILFFEAIEQEYLDDFWTMFEQHKLYARISYQNIELVLNKNSFYLTSLLRRRYIVESYSSLLADRLMSNSKNAEILIHEYLYKKDSATSSIFLPAEITPSKREELIVMYINSSDSNPNYIQLIFESRNNEMLPLGIRTKHSARLQYDKYVENHFSNNPNSGMKLSLEVSFDSEYEEPIKEYKYLNGSTQIVFGEKWVSSNLDFPTLWNNFIYMLEFVDNQCRCNFVSSPISPSVFERIICNRGKSTYPRGHVDMFNNSLYNTTLKAYRSLLDTYKISIESMITWFFSKYLKEEFTISEFVVNTPSDNTTYLEKCKMLATEIDSVLKQFDMFARDGCIDRGLFEFNSNPMITENIPSLLKQKYFYAASDSCFASMNCLFSDQTSLTYTKNSKKEYSTLFDLIRKQKVLYTDFHDYNLPAIDLLISQKCVIRQEDSLLKLNNRKVYILKDLYDHQVCFSLYYQNLSGELTEMEQNGEIRFSSALFSEPEQNYLAYVLTQSKYSNGLDLRNRYVHGNYPRENFEQAEDYFELLKTFVFIILKINQEFCCFFPVKQNIP